MAKKQSDRPSIYKQSISLYPADIDRIDQIKAYLLKRGIRNLADSEAIRLAVRLVEIGDGLVSTYEGMRDEDRRRKK